MKRLRVRESCELRSFIAGELGLSKGKAKDLIDTRRVFVNDRRVWIAGYTLKPGDNVDVPFHGNNTGMESEISILYRDEYLAAVFKPAGIITESAHRSLENMLKEKEGFSTARAAHRLDKDTSGVVLFSLAQDVHDALVLAWANHTVTKTYLAVAIGSAPFDKKTVDIPVEGKTARSIFRVVDKNNHYTLFEAVLETGRKYQVRRHLACLGLPLLGDNSLGKKTAGNEIEKNIPRQMLHAVSINFTHPVTGAVLNISAPLPADFMKTLRNLKLEFRS